VAKQNEKENLYKLKLLEKKVEEEKELNRKITNIKNGEFIAYGNEIQLMHCDSDLLMTAKKWCAVVDKSCNKVELCHKGSGDILFKVLPWYKYRQEGDKIFYNDQIILLNSNTNLYLHITEKWLSKNEFETVPIEDWRSKDPDWRCPPETFIRH